MLAGNATSLAQEDHLSVTVVIPCHNASKWVARAIQSVLHQDCLNLQIVVVDDGSSDDSLDVLSRFGTNIQLLTGPNHGACAARNRGLQVSTSKYILFLDADDYIDPGSLTAWVEAASDASADIVLAPFAYEH